MTKKLEMHGRDHRPGGSDPIPGLSFGGGGPFPIATGVGAPTFLIESTIIDEGKFDAFPSLAVNHFGVLFVVYMSGPSEAEDSKLAYQTSTDGGATWSTQTILATPPAGHRYGSPGIVATSTGRLIVSFWEAVNGFTIITAELRMIYSDDAGVTWSAPAGVTGFSHWSATAGPILQHSSGALLWPVYGQDVGDTADRGGVLISSDNGVSWSSVRNITAQNSAQNEIGLAEFLDGSVHAYIRKDGATPQNYYTASSTDAGLTWSAVTSLGFSGTPGYPGATIVPAPQVLILFYRSATNEEIAYRYSFDYGANWSSEIIYIASVSEYAAGVALTPNIVGYAIGVKISDTSVKIVFASMAVQSSIPVSAPPPTAKGDMIAATGPNIWGTIPVGNNDYVLTADSSGTYGVRWKAATGGTGGASALLDWAERSTDFVLNNTTAASAGTWIAGGSVVYDGSQRVMLEAHAPVTNADASHETIVNIWDANGSTDMGRMLIQDSTGPLNGAVTFTPSVGTHAYVLKAWAGGASGKQISAGTSSASGPLFNAFYRITKS